jgi:HEAT repeat protein
LFDLLDNLHVEVRTAAAFSLGRLGRREVLPTLVELLKRAPSPDAIEAVTPIADEDCVVLLARIARTLPDLAEPALDALEVIEHPRAAQLLEAFPERGSG